ncbi:response regulator [Candidatus Sumerlaeota bacterium]|nr:response regulator [Candidatus Sumerlaeota bacterium]
MPTMTSGEDVFFRLSGHVDRDAVRDLLFFLDRTPLPGSCEYRIDCSGLLSAPSDLFPILASRSQVSGGGRGCIRLEHLSEPLRTALGLAGFCGLIESEDAAAENGSAHPTLVGALPGHPEEARAHIARLETAVAAANPQGRILFVNKAFERLLGCNERQVRGLSVSALLETPKEEKAGEKTAALFAQAGTGDAIVSNLKVWAVRRERCADPLLVTSLPLREANWPARTIVCVVPDLGLDRVGETDSASTRAEISRAVGRDVPIPLFRMRLDDGRLLDCNERFAKTFGYESREDALMRFSFGDHLAPFTEIEGLLQHLSRKREIDEERLFLKRDAERFWGRFVACACSDDPRAADGSVVVIDDFKRIERELRESEERCARLMDSATAFTYTVRVRRGQTVSVRVSKGCEAFTGHTPEDFAANPLLLVAVVHDSDKPLLLEQVRHILAGSQVDPVFYRITHRDSTVRWVRSSAVSSLDTSGGEVGRYDVLVEDVTENRRLKEELRQAEKMEAVGQLTGGIAHDFNNLLTGILGNLSLAELDAPASIRPSLAEAQRAGERAVSLVRQLLSFSRKGPSVIEAVNMATIISEVAEIARNTFDRRIAIRTDIPSDLHTVLGDPTRMHQVLLNLCLNARDALEEMMRGESASADFHILISARNVKTSPKTADKQTPAHAGHFVEISVADNGVGMNVDVREKIFDPFYTTKGDERGTGLGLATVRSIIEHHQGWIDVESMPRQGTTFRFYLPRALRKESAATLPESKEMPHGRETVLVIDDERMIRDMLRNILQRLGYNVLLASDGLEGTEIYKRRASEIDLVILDMSMPALSGGEVLRQLRALDPGVRVVVSSGYSTLRIDDEDHMWENVDILAKPYRPSRLAQTVRQALDKPVPKSDPSDQKNK